jgi:preprotein translocase subunit SecD
MNKLISILILSISMVGCNKNVKEVVSYKNADFQIYYVKNHSDYGVKLFKDSINNLDVYVDTTYVICDQNNLKNIEIKKNAYGPYLDIQLDEKGAEEFSIATEKSVGNKLAIISHNKLLSAPYVNEQINGGKLSISGKFTLQDVINIKNEITNNNQN